MWLRAILPAVLLAFASTTATAETLGGVLDKGAKKVSPKEAVEVFLTGVLHGETSSGGAIEISYKSDGTFTGSVAGNPFTDATWRISGDRVCADYWIPAYNISRKDVCVYWFRLENTFYYAPQSDSDRDQEVAIRTFEAR